VTHRASAAAYRVMSMVTLLSDVTPRVVPTCTRFGPSAALPGTVDVDLSVTVVVEAHRKVGGIERVSAKQDCVDERRKKIVADDGERTAAPCCAARRHRGDDRR